VLIAFIVSLMPICNRSKASKCKLLLDFYTEQKRIQQMPKDERQIRNQKECSDYKVNRMQSSCHAWSAYYDVYLLFRPYETPTYMGFPSKWSTFRRRATCLLSLEKHVANENLASTIHFVSAELNWTLSIEEALNSIEASFNAFVFLIEALVKFFGYHPKSTASNIFQRKTLVVCHSAWPVEEVHFELRVLRYIIFPGVRSRRTLAVLDAQHANPSYFFLKLMEAFIPPLIRGLISAATHQIMYDHLLHLQAIQMTAAHFYENYFRA
jgi:hypothetical protein